MDRRPWYAMPKMTDTRPMPLWMFSCFSYGFAFIGFGMASIYPSEPARWHLLAGLALAIIPILVTLVQALNRPRQAEPSP